MTKCDTQHGVAPPSGNTGETVNAETAEKQAPTANLVPWPKGKSGNPKGRPKWAKDVTELARQNAPKAFQKVVELIESEDERVAFMAAREVLDRAWGKTKPADDENGKNGNVTVNIVRLCVDENGQSTYVPMPRMN